MTNDFKPAKAGGNQRDYPKRSMRKRSEQKKKRSIR